MAIMKAVRVLCLIALVSGCAKASVASQAAESRSPPLAKSSKALSEIDLSKIGHIAPKGRVQDKDYNDLEVVDYLIANGKASLPYLISKLDDTTVIHRPLVDFWPELTVGDVAFLILCDFSLDSRWTKETIPGANFNEFFGGRKNPQQPAWEYYHDQLAKRGRHWVKAKWWAIWTTYGDRIAWDEKERCFKLV
jgi:hypothetical protein